MPDILKSASKIVFIMLTTTACVAFLWGKMPVDQFMLLCSSAFAFYFSNKGSSNEAYLGK